MLPIGCEMSRNLSTSPTTLSKDVSSLSRDAKFRMTTIRNLQTHRYPPTTTPQKAVMCNIGVASAQ